jgi:hypothetical protein
MHSQWVRGITSVATITLSLVGSLYVLPPAPSLNQSEASAENWYFTDRPSTLLRKL